MPLNGIFVFLKLTCYPGLAHLSAFPVRALDSVAVNGRYPTYPTPYPLRATRRYGIGLAFIHPGNQRALVGVVGVAAHPATVCARVAWEDRLYALAPLYVGAPHGSVARLKAACEQSTLHLPCHTDSGSRFPADSAWCFRTRKRQGEPEPGACSWSALNPHLSPVALNNRPTNMQPQPEPKA